ncbi:MAG: hypothetical protein C0501_27390 [Isosphaera sp.]|nr:hypothetical protein [Isosphaera sp.]
MNTLLLLLAAAPADPPPAPLHCPAPVAALGDRKAGAPLAHTFDLTHTGAGTLTVTKVEAGCGCFRQVLTAAVLKPGESAKLTLEVNTLTQPDGPNRWQAAVAYRTDAPGRPPEAGELLLQVTATLSREVAVTPPQVGFSTAAGATQVLTVTDTRGTPLKVVRAATTSPHLAAEVGPRADGKPSAQAVTVKLSADAPAGQTDEAVVLLTDDPAYPELRVPVRVRKRAAGAVTAAPDAVRFAAGGAEVSALVQLRADGKPVGIAAVDTGRTDVTAKWAAGSGPVAVVRVTVTEAAAAGPGACEVRVKLAEPAGGEVVVPVSWAGGKK